MTMFIKLKFWPPSTPKSQTLGHAWPRDRIKIPSNMFISFILRRHTKFRLKIFEIDVVIEIKWYLTFWPLPKAPGVGDPKNCAIHVSNSHTKSGWIWEKKFLDPKPPTVPPSPTPGAWPRQQNENPVWYVLYLSILRRHTKFGLKIFEIDFVIEIKWYLTFLPLPRAPGGGDQKNWAVACAIDVSYSHTKSGRILEKKIFLDHSSLHGTPKSDPWGMTQARD